MRKSDFLPVLLSVGACAAIGLSCGKNLAGPGTDILLGLPQNLTAVSVDSAHVLLNWSPASNGPGSVFAGYKVSWGTGTDTVPGTRLFYLAGPLPTGPTTFTVQSRDTAGRLSDPVHITWAPAARFDVPPLVIVELDPTDPSNSNSGIDAGSRMTNPSVLAMDPTSQAKVDFFLEGPVGGALLLRSASKFQSSWNTTLFSTVVTASPSLNAPLASFPPETSFTLPEIQASDSSVFYARIQGDPNEVNYVRIHIHYLPGLFPNRSVEVRLSLQRVPGLLFARSGRDRTARPALRARQGRA